MRRAGRSRENPFQYTGRENDGTGLLHYRFRYYSPEMQRFISEDPIRLRGGVNYYLMTGNNPVNWADPFGLKPGDWWDPSGHISLSFSSTDSSGRGKVLSSGVEQDTYTLGSLGGASLDLQIGNIPKPCEKTKEIAVGPLGKYLGIGYFWSKNSNSGGIAFHFGVGFSSPVTHTTTSPTNTALPPTFPSDLEWRQGK